MSDQIPVYSEKPAMVQQQPVMMQQPQPAMVQQQPITAQPQAFNMTEKSDMTAVDVADNNTFAQPREWTHGFCDCFSDCETCLLAYVCPCIVYSRTKQAFKKKEKSDDFYLDCFIGYVMMVANCWPCFGGYNRSKIREKYNIAGDSCSDCCIHCFCPVCALVQEKREVEQMTNKDIV